MDRQPHNNLWAEKLLQVSMPDSGEAWVGMEAILDRQMPQRFRSDRRRWLLLILLLLLLIGVCNCPGRGRLFHPSGHDSRTSGAHPAIPAKTPGGATATTPSSSAATPAIPSMNPAAPANPTTPATAATTPANPASPANPPPPAGANPASPSPSNPEPTTHATRGVRSGPLPPASVTARKRHLPGTTDSATRPHRPTPALTPTARSVPAAPRHVSRPRTTPHGSSNPPAAFGDITRTTPLGSSLGKNPARRRRRPPAKITGAKTTAPAATADTTMTAGNDTTRSSHPRRDTAAKKNVTAAGDTSARKNTPALAKAVPRKDTAHKKPPPPPPDQDEKERDHGWVFGIGLNQFFPIGGQKGSTYNSDGLTGTLSDYLPVPMIRYYLNHKAYLQVEAQLNTPQATKKNLVFNAPEPDTITIRGSRIETSATLQQLYYFNVPLSFHYAVTDDLNIGTGLQFSHLSNAIGSFDSTVTNLTTNEVTNPKDTKSFKDDSLFHRIRTNEFRFLIDASYTWKHFVVGVRYNQALSKFIDLQLPTGGSTQSRNSSLQLYLRYILWDTRKKKAPPKTP